MGPTVSIIVPVYNAEATIRRCVDSILDQKYSDFELLLVDDGSTDASGAICDAYAARDGRVRVFHQENSGVSAARNWALDHASGDYLQFLDSDDWIIPDATGLLVRAAQEHGCDMVISDFYRVVGEKVAHKGDIGDEGVLGREQYAAHMMENPADFYYGVLWNKLYRRAIVEEHHLRMDQDIRWCEDFMFNLEYIRYASAFYALQVPIYYYVKTKGSLAAQGMHLTKVIRMKLMVFECYQQFYKDVLDEAEYEKCRLKVYRFLIEAAGDGAVPPLALGSKKLGDERVSVCPGAVVGEGSFMDSFLDRKLLESCLEPVAHKYDLTVLDVWLMLALRQITQVRSRKDLADFLHLSRSSLTVELQRLSGKGLLGVDDGRQGEKPVKKQLKFTFLPKAAPLLADLEQVQNRYDQARTMGLSEEELTQYTYLVGKIRENIQNAVKN